MSTAEALSRFRETLERHRGWETDPSLQDALWHDLATGPFRDQGIAFEDQWAAYQAVFAGRPADAPPPAAWQPDPEEARKTNLAWLMDRVGLDDYVSLHRWSVENRADFWQLALERIGAMFEEEPTATLGGGSAEDPVWLPGARLNCAVSCFQAPAEAPAIVVASEADPTPRTVSVGELRTMANRVASGLSAMGLREGDAVALYMPMNVECVAAYLGVVLLGGQVVSIPDSFAPPEIATRLRIAGAKAIVTSEAFVRGGKTVPLYEKVVEAGAPSAIVIPTGQAPLELREDDTTWEAMLGLDSFDALAGPPDRVSNVLFSSGTTGEPKGIPWTQLTPFKSAVDGHFHQDIRPGDVVAWPTNIGWMMGPWLIYAALCNRATIALYEGAPTSREFCRFVEESGVTMLGLVPSIVRAWRASGATEDVDWSAVRCFSSTGESSNAQDYLWLMSRTGYRAPVVEYCGGTEVGGGHITGTLVQAASPATFSTPALGLDFVVLKPSGRPADVGEMGELFLVPPSLGLSQRLLNKDHHEVYYAQVPPGPDGQVLRRHGDEVSVLPGGYFRAEGRADDTMNLGGIKVSSIELERAMDGDASVAETAAVAITPDGGGADSLVVFVVPLEPATVDEAMRKRLQARIRSKLNPLFRIHEVVEVDSLPRTASNKVMRRTLRARFRDRPSAEAA